MSGFNSIFPTKNCMKKYVLFANDLREMVMFAFDENDKAIDFSCGNFEDVFLNSFVEEFDGVKIAIIDCDPSEFNCRSWNDLCDKLNAKRANIQKTLMEKLSFSSVALKFIEYNFDANMWHVKTLTN